MSGFKDGELTWCTVCERFFIESLQEHGGRQHSDEKWDVDYSKTPEDGE